MKIRFKNLEHSNIKIENPIDIFGLNTFIEISNYYELMPQRCAINAQKLAAHCIVDNKHFEYVECVLERYRNDKAIYHPHCISYWNGHYLDFTLSLAKAYNILDKNTCIIMPADKCIPIRRYEWTEIKKFIDYGVKNDLDIFLTFMNNYYHIDENGKIIPPNENNNWIRVTQDGIDNINIIERDKFTIN